MPPSTRRRAQHHLPPPPAEFSDSVEELDEEELDPEEQDGDDMGDEMAVMEGEEDLDEDGLASPGGPETSLPNLDPPPSHLREISTLASWTVSSSKPGCSIPQLRHPSPSLFWQSDGPQPHYLNIHFFKLVRIVGLRLYLDFEQDESYTPTRIVFLAGSGMNDLQEWSEMRLESPRGWIWADFSNVSDASDSSSPEGSEDEDNSESDDAFQTRMLQSLTRTRNRRRSSEHRSSDSENMPLPPQRQRVPSNFPAHLDVNTPNGPPGYDTYNTPINPPQLTAAAHRTPHFTPHTFTPPTIPHQTPNVISPPPRPRLPFNSHTHSLSPAAAPPSQPRLRAPRRPKMPVLRAHLVQIKIMENHQNGKDTHLRGLQIFARNDEDGGRSPVRVARVTASDAVTGVEVGEVGTVRTGRERRERREEVLELGGMGGLDIR
ncbi:anaphase promoting complex subunit doc1 [Curvularia kusanoi]|uniref:Anaphase promoting complex subunit doc1 n=1 Tax=Curvularia kusanoi TaxID=90978 RepID=A0A9P4T902_CURKU|nr:anaphase promoting complex subunit doc1 [Curvularia kusanoi]